MSQQSYSRMTEFDQILEHIERHLQRLHQRRMQRYTLIQHAQEKIMTTRHKMIISHMLIQETSNYITDKRTTLQKDD